MSKKLKSDRSVLETLVAAVGRKAKQGTTPRAAAEAVFKKRHQFLVAVYKRWGMSRLTLMIGKEFRKIHKTATHTLNLFPDCQYLTRRTSVATGRKATSHVTYDDITRSEERWDQNQKRFLEDPKKKELIHYRAVMDLMEPDKEKRKTLTIPDAITWEKTHRTGVSAVRA